MDIRWISTTPESRWEQRTAAPSDSAPNLELTGAVAQSIEGFGGCFNEMGWDALAVLDQAQREEALKALFGPGEGCRFTMGRVPIGASDFALKWYSHNETDGDYAMEHFSIARDREYLLPYIKAAMEHRPELWLFASPWSPPTWMKTRRVFNYGVLRWEPEVLEALALYFLKFVQSYRAEGVNVRQIHVQNEPSADQKFPSCRWTGARLRDFIRDYLGPLFESEQPDCKPWLGTINGGDYDEFVLTALADEKARGYIGGVGLQWGGKGIIQRAHAAWPSMPLMQTENECGDGRNTWDYAHYVFTLLWHYLSNGANAYCYWNMALPLGGESTWGWPQNSMICVDRENRRVIYNPEFYVMRHFSQFTRPGARRLELAGPWAGNAVAFANPDGGVVVTAANALDRPRALALQVGGDRVALQSEPRSFNTVVFPPGAILL
ncbi:MAG: glycosyl hydrolase [Planctomycetes bacterium]|nr:glycosyl hydrolase [Planctomycetota bacterium]